MGTVLTKLDPLVRWINKFKKKPEKTSVAKEGTPYAEIRDELESFTLVFFKGPNFVSDLIRYLEKVDASKINQYNLKVEKDAFSHVGFIIRSDILDDERVHEDGVYIFESTMSGSLGEGVYNLDGEPFLGMQIRNFDDVLAAYDSDPRSRVAIAPLKREILEDLFEDDELKKKFSYLFAQYEGVKYDWNAYSLLSSLLSCLRPERDELEIILGTEKWQFCSEAVASIYVKLGILPKTVNPKDVVPMDYLGYDDEKAVPEIIEELTYIVKNS